MTDKRLLNGPAIEQICDYYQPPLPDTSMPPDPSKEVVVLARACFQGIAPRVYDSHLSLVRQMQADYGGNFWCTPTHERMPFPDAPLFSIASMMLMEKEKGVKADWFLWIEDDVSVPASLMRDLRASADPEERPFMACVGFDRYPPFPPAVWDKVDGELKQWLTVPDEGVYKVFGTGLVAALFHRSIFDKLEEPFFATTSNSLDRWGNGISISKGAKPDVWFINQMHRAGIPVHVDCKIVVTHFGLALPINKRTAPALRELSFLEKHELERETRGKQPVQKRNSSDVHAGVRQSRPSGLDVAHEASNEAGVRLPVGQSGAVLDTQDASAARPKLSDEQCIDLSDAKW